MKLLSLLGLVFFSLLVFSEPALQVSSQDKNGVRWLYFSVADAQDVYGADLKLKFDKKKLRVVDVDARQPGIQVARGSMFGEQAYEVANYVDVRKGHARIAASLLHPAPAVSGTGVIAVIGFTHQQAVDAQIWVSRLQLGNKDGVLTEVRYPEAILVEPAQSQSVTDVQPVGVYVPGENIPASTTADAPANNTLLLIIAALLLLVVVLLLVVLIKRPTNAA